MMHGLLPDSAIVGTYKRTRRTRRKRRVTADPTGIAFLFGLFMFAYVLITR